MSDENSRQRRDTNTRQMKGSLWIMSYISFSIGIVVSDNIPSEVKFLAFGALNLMFASMLVDDPPKEGQTIIGIEFSEAELSLIFEYFQDPSGTGPNSKMNEYLDEKNLWPVYETAIEKIIKERPQ